MIRRRVGSKISVLGIFMNRVCDVFSERSLFISCTVIISGICLFVPVAGQQSHQIQSRYAVITYDSPQTLRTFNKKLYVSGGLKSQVQKQGTDTIEDDVKAKINVIVEKVMVVLDMYPANLKFSIVIHPDKSGVAGSFMQIYKKKVNYIAFFSPSQRTVFFSADNGMLRVVAHEIGHVVAENYFAVSPPPRIHEVLAQYAEKHVTD